MIRTLTLGAVGALSLCAAVGTASADGLAGYDLADVEIARLTGVGFNDGDSDGVCDAMAAQITGFEDVTHFTVFETEPTARGSAGEALGGPPVAQVAGGVNVVIVWPMAESDEAAPIGDNTILIWPAPQSAIGDNIILVWPASDAPLAAGEWIVAEIDISRVPDADGGPVAVVLSDADGGSIGLGTLDFDAPVDPPGDAGLDDASPPGVYSVAPQRSPTIAGDTILAAWDAATGEGETPLPPGTLLDP